MIVPDHVLSIMSGVNPDAVEAEAHDLKKAASGIRETGANVHSTWQGLSAFYEAPEAADLFSATAPVRDDAASFAGQLEKVTGALTTYAAETRVIKRKLTDLYMQAVTFVNKTYAEKEDWRKNEDLVQENNSLLQAVDAQALAFQQAQEKAAASIYSAYGGTAPKRTMCTDDKPLTWGTPEEAENPWYEDMWDGATSFLTGFFGDGLWGDASGLWDLATSPEKWRESFENLMILGTPAIALLSPKLRGKFGETWKGFGKSFVAWDQWKQDPARALGNTAYNIVTTIIPIGKAGSAGKIAKGTRATAKVGEALDPLSLTLRAGARLPKVSDIAAQMGHKFGDLGTKLKLDLTRTKIITPHVDPATITWNRPPSPRVAPLSPDAPTRTSHTPALGHATPNVPAPAKNPMESTGEADVPAHIPEWMRREHQQEAAHTVRTSHDRTPEPAGIGHHEITNSTNAFSNGPPSTVGTSTGSAGTGSLHPATGGPQNGTGSGRLHSATGTLPSHGGAGGGSSSGSGGHNNNALEDRAILNDHDHAPPKDRRFGFGMDLEANKRYFVEDQEGNFRGIFITDKNKEIVEIHTKSGNKSDGWNPELRRPRPNTTYHVNDNLTYYTDDLGRTKRVEAELTYTGSDDHYRLESDQRTAGHTGRDEYKQLNSQTIAGFYTVHGRSPMPHEVLLFQEVNWNGGHLVGTATDGPPERINLVAMLESLNQAQPGSSPATNYRSFEDAFIKLLKSNDPPKVKLVIELEFSGNREAPTAIEVSYDIDNQFDGSYRYSNIPPRLHP